MRTHVIGIALLALLATACAPQAAAEQPQAGLDGRTFVGSAVLRDGLDEPLAKGSRLTLTFSDGRMNAQAGCNQLAGQVSLAGGRLRAAELSTTDMACETVLMDQDQWLHAFFTAGPSWALDGDELRLRGEHLELRLTDRRVADPDRPLRGTAWQVETLIDGEQASSVPAGVEAGLQIGADDQLTGQTGCNSIGGAVRIDGDSVTLDGLRMTKRGCAGDAGRVEQAVVAVLDGRVAVTIEADRLTLTHPSGRGLGLVARG